MLANVSLLSIEVMFICCVCCCSDFISDLSGETTTIVITKHAINAATSTRATTTRAKHTNLLALALPSDLLLYLSCWEYSRDKQLVEEGAGSSYIEISLSAKSVVSCVYSSDFLGAAMGVLVFSTTAYRGIAESDSWTSSGTQTFLFYFFLAKSTTAYVAEASVTISPLILAGTMLVTTDKYYFNVYNCPLYIMLIFNDVMKTCHFKCVH